MTTEQKEAIEMLEYIKHHNTLIGYKNDERDKLAESALNLIQEQEAEIKKKDKIIDNLAKAFKQDDVRSVEEIKQFYERKIEDED